MKEFSATLIRERETKRTFRYKEIDDDGLIVEDSDATIGQVYLKKVNLGPTPPEKIQVSVQEVKA